MVRMALLLPAQGKRLTHYNQVRFIHLLIGHSLSFVITQAFAIIKNAKIKDT